jgi:predicted lipoprotein with Yx(FWY)xxD motif
MKLSVVAAGLAIGAVACGSSSSAGGPAAVGAGSTGSSSSAGGSTVAQVAFGVHKTAKFGKVLTNSNGFALYVFTKDTAGVSNCSGECAVEWKPLTVPSGSALARSGIRHLSTFKRADGTRQVALKGHPLYTFVADRSAGTVTGQGVDGDWFVATPTGFTKVGAANASSNSDSSSGSAGAAATPAASPSSTPASGGGYGY